MIKNILLFIIGLLYINVFDKVMTSIYSRLYAKKCNFDCSKCGCWSCVNETKYDNKKYLIGIYDNYSNVCGKKGDITLD